MYQETNSDHTTHLIMFNHSDFTDKDPTKLNKQQPILTVKIFFCQLVETVGNCIDLCKSLEQNKLIKVDFLLFI